MSIPYSAGTSFGTPTCVGAVRKFPFANEGDSATIVYVHDMQVNRGSNAPLAFNNTMTTGSGSNDKKPSRSPFSDDANAFWVGDSDPTDMGNGIVSFQRTFARVPATRLEGNGIYAFTYPGTDSSTIVTFDTSATSTGYSIAYSTTSGRQAIFRFPVDDTSIYQVGQQFDLRNNAAGSSTGYCFEVYLQDYNPPQWVNWIASNAFVYSVDTTTNIVEMRYTFNNTSYPETYVRNIRSGVTVTTFSLMQTLPIRSSFTQNGNSRRSISYIKSDDLIGIGGLVKQFSVVNSSGTPTEILTSSTTPTKLQYMEFRSNGDYINAESSKVSRWMGNIWERVDTVVEAL